MRLSATLTRFSGHSFGLSLLSMGIFLSLGAAPAWSQSTSNATIVGQVTDEQSAAIVGAEVRIIDSATGSAQSTLSNDQGRYVIANVLPDIYAITVSKQGFTVYKISSQKVDVGTTLTINAT